VTQLLDAKAPILERRFHFVHAVCEVEVNLHAMTEEGPLFQATAYLPGDSGADRSPVVNASGYALGAIGPSPEKAATFLASALRRRYGARLDRD
jgi:hypothetical protein